MQAGGAQQAAFVARHGFGRQAAFFLELVPLLEHGIAGFGDGFSLGVVKPDLAARLCSDLGNTASHSAGANDGDLLKCKGHVDCEKTRHRAWWQDSPFVLAVALAGQTPKR